MVSDGGDWSEHRRLILAELQRLTTDVGAIRDKIDEFRQRDVADLRTEIALLKLKSSLWGAVLGATSGLLVTAAAILLRHI
jgi:hypothetical protein